MKTKHTVLDTYEYEFTESEIREALLYWFREKFGVATEGAYVVLWESVSYGNSVTGDDIYEIKGRISTSQTKITDVGVANDGHKDGVMR